jgi:hypothetical protein
VRKILYVIVRPVDAAGVAAGEFEMQAGFA